MRFSKILGPQDDTTDRLISECQRYLTEVFLELSAGWTMTDLGSKLGGDPLLMQLVVPMPHCCDLTGYGYREIQKGYAKAQRKIDVSIPLNEKDQEFVAEAIKYQRSYPQRLTTAGTDGSSFYWAPDFVLKKSKVGVRLLILHEGMHASLMHPDRRGSRVPAVWNIAIDYKANWNIFEDLRARKVRNIEQSFRELGEFITLQEYVQFIRNPYDPPPKMEEVGPIHAIRQMLLPDYVEREPETTFLLYADPNLPKEMRQPEALYQHLYSQIPKCPHCGSQFHYPKTDEYKKLEVRLAKLKELNVAKYS